MHTDLFQFGSHCTAEVSPVCAIVGGIVGQEVVKVNKICAEGPYDCGGGGWMWQFLFACVDDEK